VNVHATWPHKVALLQQNVTTCDGQSLFSHSASPCSANCMTIHEAKTARGTWPMPVNILMENATAPMQRAMLPAQRVKKEGR
jgi:hypothetical protein